MPACVCVYNDILANGSYCESWLHCSVETDGSSALALSNIWKFLYLLTIGLADLKPKLFSFETDLIED